MTIFGNPLGICFICEGVSHSCSHWWDCFGLGLSLEGMPNSTVQWFSMTALGFIGVVYFAIPRAHHRLRQLQTIACPGALQNLASQVVSHSGNSCWRSLRDRQYLQRCGIFP